MQVWLSSSLIRHYPRSAASEVKTLTLEAARGESISFQIVFKTDNTDTPVTVSIDGHPELPVITRRVGYVPMPHINTSTPLDEVEGAEHIPGYVPDPLLPNLDFHAGADETNAYWVTVRVPESIAPGVYPLAVKLQAGEEEQAELTATVNVHKAVLPKRQNFPVTHWFYADSLCDWYKTELYEDAFWPIVTAYFKNIVEHGQDTVYVPMFTPPLDGVKRPTQLLGVKQQGDNYSFDWTLVRRWIKAAQAQGVANFEWTHLFVQWGVKSAIRIYEGHAEEGKLLWPPDTGATSLVYRNFLSQLLPELHKFVTDEGLMECSFFHLADEPHGDEPLANYRAARQMLRELAPWMKVMDALSDIRFAREGLTDVPIPIISNAPAFVAEGFSPWTYFCCGPREKYLNRLLDTPLVKIRMSGWLFYKTRVQGFLHWGYNYWYKSQTQQMIDPYQVTDGLYWPVWAYGDTCMVYPGTDGPVDSLRWEIFAESLQDYTLLQACGIDPDDPMLSDIQDYAEFPRSEEWITSRRKQLLDKLDQIQND